MKNNKFIGKNFRFDNSIWVVVCEESKIRLEDHFDSKYACKTISPKKDIWYRFSPKDIEKYTDDYESENGLFDDDFKIG